MKLLAASLLASLAAACPVALVGPTQPPAASVGRRATGTTAKEFAVGGCRPNILIFSRGSTEAGNMGTRVGPPLADGTVSRGQHPGAAMVHRVVEALDAATVARVAGVVTFGGTQNLQDRGAIAGLPAEKLLIICNVGDAVCHGLLIILPPHLDYTRRVPEAVDFFLRRLRATAAATANDTVVAGAYGSKT